MPTRRRFLMFMATALAAFGLFTGDAVQAGKPPALKLTVSVSPSKIREGDTGTGTVTHNNSSTSSPVTVTLKSSDTTEATVNATVTIPAGTNTVNFAVTAIDDGIKDGPQSLTITTAATGYASASASVTIDDQKLLPPVRYVLSFPSMPGDAQDHFSWINTSNSSGEVVGWYIRSDGSAHACMYDGTKVVDLNDIAIGGIPDGWYLRSGVDINDAGVVVGTLTDAGNADRRPFALDLRAENPVVDLLPDFGAAYSVATQINEYGQILGYCRAPDGIDEYYIFDPGLYAGDPGVRALRDGIPIDMSQDSAQQLPLLDGAHSTGYIFLNNPIEGRAAQVAGDFGGVPFRYTIGGNLEQFPALSALKDGAGITDDGTFYGVFESVTTAAKGNKTQTIRTPFRFGSVYEQLPSPPYLPHMRDVNSTGDVLYGPWLTETGRSVYRDDWYGAYGIVNIDDLVIGTPADLTLWSTGNANPSAMTDRIPFVNAGQIVGNLRNGTQAFFVLTPVPW